MFHFSFRRLRKCPKIHMLNVCYDVINVVWKSRIKVLVVTGRTSLFTHFKHVECFKWYHTSIFLTELFITKQKYITKWIQVFFYSHEITVWNEIPGWYKCNSFFVVFVRNRFSQAVFGDHLWSDKLSEWEITSLLRIGIQQKLLMKWHSWRITII